MKTLDIYYTFPYSKDSFPEQFHPRHKAEDARMMVDCTIMCELAEGERSVNKISVAMFQSYPIGGSAASLKCDPTLAIPKREDQDALLLYYARSVYGKIVDNFIYRNTLEFKEWDQASVAFRWLTEGDADCLSIKVWSSRGVRNNDPICRFAIPIGEGCQEPLYTTFLDFHIKAPGIVRRIIEADRDK